jgi:hypothetical protein
MTCAQKEDQLSHYSLHTQLHPSCNDTMQGDPGSDNTGIVKILDPLEFPSIDCFSNTLIAEA